MNLNKFFVLAYLPFGLALSFDEIKDRIGDGCANKISLKSAYFTDAGSTCTSCHFCPGSTLHALFDPKTPATCIDCGTSDNDCNQFRLITTFERAWKLWFFSLLSSDAPASDDPKRIILEGSNNFNGQVESSTNTWTTLFDSDNSSGLSFSGRSAKESFVFTNEQDFKSYAITFIRKSDSSKLQLGGYGVVQSYTAQCSSELFEKLTGKLVAAYPTSAPTDAPTVAPTNKPTAAPTNKPTLAPTNKPTDTPTTSKPTNYPTRRPTNYPTKSPTNPPTTNLARSGYASQSSTYNGRHASTAINGNTYGGSEAHCSHTEGQCQAWWKVTLNRVAVITKIIVWNRSDGWGHRLSQSDVKIINSSGQVVATRRIGTANANRFEFNYDNVSGKTVMVQLTRSDFLQLAEVQVFGY